LAVEVEGVWMLVIYEYWTEEVIVPIAGLARNLGLRVKAKALFS
jgi:hypothetical protein